LRAFADGRSALEMLKHERPDIILLDISMPDMDGFEVLEKVKEAYPDIDVIMMSAYTKDEHIEMALKMGALTCLNKPVQVEKILDVVDKMKTKQQQERGKTSILLVEDDTALSSTLATILQDNHYTVSSVPTGIGAIEESKKKFYNAAIVDFKLPDMSGIDVIKQLKNVNPQAVIILMTAYESLDLAINAIKEHVFDFLVKPVEPDTLLKSLRKGLHL
jgi:DNA-binding NtrC family response regulator